MFALSCDLRNCTGPVAVQRMGCRRLGFWIQLDAVPNGKSKYVCKGVAYGTVLGAVSGSSSEGCFFVARMGNFVLKCFRIFRF